jgi:gliding motility-associated-like protein
MKTTHDRQEIFIISIATLLKNYLNKKNMMRNLTRKEPTFFQAKKLTALTLFFCLQILSFMPALAQNPVVTDSATYDVFMNLDPSRGLNPTNFATDVSTYLNAMGATAGTYRITTSAVTLDPTDVAKWEVFDHYDQIWYANQAAWSASPGGFNNGNIPSNWYYYPVSDPYYDAANSKITIAQLLAGQGTWGSTGRLQSHIYPFVENGKPAMQFYGYSSIGAADFLYYPADVASTKTVKFNIDAQKIDTHTLISAGFLINGGTSGTGASKTISGYLLLVNAGLTNVSIYKLTNVNIDNLHNSGTGAPGTLVASYSSTIYSQSHIELSITSTSVTATIQQVDASGNLLGSKSTMFNSLAITNSGYGGFGPFVYYSSHGCTSASAFRFSNLEMAFGGVLSGNSSLEAYKYAEFLDNSTKRFFVNLTNTSATNYAATSNDADNAYLTRIKNDSVIFITDESTGTYLPGTLNQNIKNVSVEPTDATLAAALGLPNLSSLTAAQQLAAKTAYLILHSTLGSYGTIPTSTTTAIASLFLMDGPGTDASWTGANQVNEIKSWLVSGSNINIYLNPDNSLNAGGLTATYQLKDPVGTVTTITTSTDANGKKYFSFPKASATGNYSVTLTYATGGSITSTVPATSTFRFDPVPALDGNPVISGTMKYGQTLTVTPNITSVPGITGTLSYQWKANGTIISGATLATYTLKASEIGKTITCDITSNAQPGTKTATATGSVSKITLSSATVSVVTGKTYNGTTATTGGTIVFSGTANSENPTCNATIVWSSANAGTSTVNVTGISLTSLTDRYDLSFNSLSNVTPGNNASITNASLTVTGSSVTSKIYDGTTSATISGATLSGKVGSDDVTLGNATSGAFNNANVGTGKSVSTTMTISGTASGNYTLTQPTLTGNITAKGLTVTSAAVTSKTYDGTTSATITGATLSGVLAGDASNVTLGSATSGTFASAGIGTGKSVTTAMTISGSASGNYSLTQPTLTGNITAKELTVINASVTSKTYDRTTSAAITGATLSGVLAGDASNVTLGGTTSGTFATASAGTGISVTTAMTITGTASANYSLTQPTLTGDILAKGLTVTGASVTTKTYDGTTSATITGATLSGVLAGDASNVTLGSSTSGTFASSGIGTGKSITTAMTISGTASGNYSLTQPTLTGNILAKELTVTGASVTPKNYDGTTSATITGATLSGVLTGDASNVNLGSATSGTFASAGIGTGKSVTTAMIISGSASGNYTLTQPTLSGNIIAKELTVTGAQVTSKIYDGNKFATITGASLSGVVNDEDVTLGNTGSGIFASANAANGINVVTTITISGAAVANYTLTQPTLSGNITEKAISVTAEAKTKVFGDTDPALTYTFTPALIEGDAFTGALSRTTGENAGTYAINQNDLALSSNYTVTFTSADLTVEKATLTVTAENKSKIYGDANPALTFTYLGWKSGNSASDLTTQPSAATTVDLSSPVNVYTDAITVSGAADENYDFSYVPADFEVTKATLTVTAQNKSKIYGDANPALTFTCLGWKNGNSDSDLITLPSVATTVDLSSPVNVYTGAITVSGAADENYDFSYVPADFEVTKASLTVTADNKERIYGESNPALTLTYNGFKNDDGITSIDSAPVPSTTVVATTAAGVYPISLTAGTDNNYDITAVDGTITINKALLTVTAAGQTRIYGDANPALSFSITGFMNDENDSVIDNKPTTSTAADETSSTGSYPIIPSSGSDGNYDFAYVNGTLTITKAPLTITADNKNRKYGEINPQLTLSFNGFRNNDDQNVIDLMPQVGTSAVPTTPAGNMPIVLTGGNDNNYDLTLTDGQLTIVPTRLVITSDSKTKVYGQDNPSLTITYSGFVNNETESDLTTPPHIVLTADKFSSTGVYPLTLEGAASGNYDIVYTEGSLTVTKAPLTITARDRSSVYLGQIPSLTAVYTGLLNGDVVTMLDQAPTLSTAATAGSDAGVYAITVSGGSDNNYSYVYVNGSLTISKANQTIEFKEVPSGLRTTQVFSLQATSTSGLRVYFESADPSIASVNGSVLTINKEGSVVITALQNGDHNWNPASDVRKSVVTLPTFDNITSLFTPNADGMNDHWYIPDIEQYGQIAVKIYNRYGKLIYESADYKNDWNGTFNGAQLPSASYYYIIKSSAKGTIAGTVNIIR